MFGVRATFFVAALLVADTAAHAQTSFNTIYGFGDSYADTNRAPDSLNPGGLWKRLGYPENGPFPSSSPEGRFSDGLNFVDRLQANFNIPEAVNYAIGGALTNQANVAGIVGGFQTEIGLVDHTFSSRDIIAISIGGNNANAILGGLNLGPDPARALQSLRR